MIPPWVRLLGQTYEALRFLTRLPLPGRPVLRGPGEVAGAFPLAGLLLGLVAATLDLLLAAAGLGGMARDALVVVGLVFLSGGLHLDGLMDTLDGLLGGHTAEARLAIMRDSRLGAYGVLAGVCVLLLKVGLLGALIGRPRTAALLLTPLLGRAAIVLGAAVFPPARPVGLGAAFRIGLSPRRLGLAAGTALFGCWALAGNAGLLALAGCAGLALAMGAWIAARVGGLTGDSYGALCELTETAALLAFALLR